MKKLVAVLVVLMMVGVVGTGRAQPMKGMERANEMGQKAQAASSVEDQLRQIQEDLKGLRKELTELKRAPLEGQMPMGPGQMPMGSEMMGGPMGPMMPQMMQPMRQMMQACGQMMAMMGQMGEMTPPSKVQSAQERQTTEHGTKKVDGLEVTLISAPPLSQAEMQRMMAGMGGMGRMQGMGGMMGGMPGMGGMGGPEAPPTHYMGVLVSDLKDGRVVHGLQITLTARKDGLTRTVTLMPMPGSYGANINLPEKGHYTATVSIARPGQPVSVVFDFEYE